MAGKAKKTTSVKAKTAATSAMVKPQFSTPSDLPNYYVNHIEINVSKYEFALTAGRLPARMTDEQKQDIEENMRLLVEPTLQLLIPPNLINGLIKALNTQKDMYEKHFGKLDGDE